MSSAKSGVTSQPEDQKPNIPSTHVNLKVKTQEGDELLFRVRRDIELKKLMTQFCEHQSLALPTVQFLFEGRYIRGGQTPDQLQMEDGDEIDAMLHHMGA